MHCILGCAPTDEILAGLLPLAGFNCAGELFVELGNNRFGTCPVFLAEVDFEQAEECGQCVGVIAVGRHFEPSFGLRQVADFDEELPDRRCDFRGRFGLFRIDTFQIGIERGL